jgi:hypothetical protein
VVPAIDHWPPAHRMREGIPIWARLLHRLCRCRKPHPCWSGGMVVLVEDAVESITSSDDEVIQSA